MCQNKNRACHDIGSAGYSSQTLNVAIQAIFNLNNYVKVFMEISAFNQIGAMILL